MRLSGDENQKLLLLSAAECRRVLLRHSHVISNNWTSQNIWLHFGQIMFIDGFHVEQDEAYRITSFIFNVKCIISMGSHFFILK